MEPDHYAALQVDPRAESEVIDAAYRRLATKYHPDRNHSPDATDRMKLINAAYEVLSDPEKRTAYDLRRGFSPGQVVSSQGFSWTPLLLVLGVVLLMALAVLVRFNPRFLLIVGVLLLVAWTLHILRTPGRD